MISSWISSQPEQKNNIVFLSEKYSIVCSYVILIIQKKTRNNYEIDDYFTTNRIDRLLHIGLSRWVLFGVEYAVWKIGSKKSLGTEAREKTRKKDLKNRKRLEKMVWKNDFWKKNEFLWNLHHDFEGKRIFIRDCTKLRRNRRVDRRRKTSLNIKNWYE